MSTLTKYSLSGIAGIIAVVLFGVVIVLQLLLAAGILPVSMSWGGRQTTLTTGLRFASLGAAVILVCFAYVISHRAGLVGEVPPSTLIKVISWLVTAYLAFNTLGNFTSPSAGEKWLFGPITLVLLICCFVVSISKSAIEQ